jgi:hypothetical protein
MMPPPAVSPTDRHHSTIAFPAIMMHIFQYIAVQPSLQQGSFRKMKIAINDFISNL